MEPWTCSFPPTLSGGLSHGHGKSPTSARNPRAPQSRHRLRCTLAPPPRKARNGSSPEWDLSDRTSGRSTIPPDAAGKAATAAPHDRCASVNAIGRVMTSFPTKVACGPATSNSEEIRGAPPLNIKKERDRGRRIRSQPPVRPQGIRQRHSHARPMRRRLAGPRWLDEVEALGRDIRFAVRSLLRAKALAATVI